MKQRDSALIWKLAVMLFGSTAHLLQKVTLDKKVSETDSFIRTLNLNESFHLITLLYGFRFDALTKCYTRSNFSRETCGMYGINLLHYLVDASFHHFLSHLLIIRRMNQCTKLEQLSLILSTRALTIFSIERGIKCY